MNNNVAFANPTVFLDVCGLFSYPSVNIPTDSGECKVPHECLCNGSTGTTHIEMMWHWMWEALLNTGFNLSCFLSNPPPPVASFLTCVAGLAAHSEVDMALLCSLLHQLHNQLVRLSHHCCAVHAYQFVTGPQASVLVCRSVFHYVADVDLKQSRWRRFSFNAVDMP